MDETWRYVIASHCLLVNSKSWEAIMLRKHLRGNSMHISISKLKPSGDLMLSTIINGHYFKHRYSGYSRASAVEDFKQLIKQREVTV